jgi:hypothetical protein
MIAINRLFDRPPESTLQWCQTHVNKIQNGGFWCIPRSHTLFRVNHTDKQLELVEAGNDNDDDFYATQHTFSFIGWDVVDCIEQGKNE